MATFFRGDARDDQQKFIEEKRRKIQEKLAAAQNKLALGNNTSTTPTSVISNSTVPRPTSAL